jgi:hypothetical protein
MATKKAMIKEYGGKEKYASKSAMMRHEKKESPAVEKREKAKPVKKFNGGPMSASRPMPPQGAAMPPQRRPMPPQGAAMPPQGRPMPPEGRPMPPQGGFRGRGAPVAPAMKKGGSVRKSSDKMGRAVSRKTADVKGRAMKKGA